MKHLKTTKRSVIKAMIFSLTILSISVTTSCSPEDGKNGNTIEGTFSYTAQNFIGLCTGNPIKNITEGTFKVTFQ